MLTYNIIPIWFLARINSSVGNGFGVLPVVILLLGTRRSTPLIVSVSTEMPPQTVERGIALMPLDRFISQGVFDKIRLINLVESPGVL